MELVLVNLCCLMKSPFSRWMKQVSEPSSVFRNKEKCAIWMLWHWPGSQGGLPYSGVQMHVLALSELCWYKILMITFPLAHNTPSLLWFGFWEKIFSCYKQMGAVACSDQSVWSWGSWLEEPLWISLQSKCIPVL